MADEFNETLKTLKKGLSEPCSCKRSEFCSCDDRRDFLMDEIYRMEQVIHANNTLLDSLRTGEKVDTVEMTRRLSRMCK